MVFTYAAIKGTLLTHTSDISDFFPVDSETP